MGHFTSGRTRHAYYAGNNGRDNDMIRTVVHRVAVRLMPRLQEGAKLPTGFGMAWFDGTHVVALPLGLNVLAGVGRRLWFGLVAGVAPSHIDKLILATQRSAREAGRDDAVQEIQRQVEARFGQRVRDTFAGGPNPPTPAAIAEATADATDLEYWSAEDRVLFQAAQELARRRGDALYMACQDPRCAMQPILGRIDGDGGFWLACMHKRRWVPTPKGPQPKVSRRALARVGIH